MKNTVELNKEKEALKTRCKTIVEGAKTEMRMLSQDELNEIDSNKERISGIDEEIRSIEDQLKSYDNLLDFNTKKVNVMKAEERNVTVGESREKVSLLKMIEKAASHRNFSDAEEDFISRGKALNASAGLATSGDIQIATESRAAFTVGTDHNDMVATDIQNILDPLRAKNVLVQAGAKFLTGLRGDIQYPILSGANVGWLAETASASDGAGTISAVSIQPKRLSAYVDISKQFLAQDSADCEAAILRDIVNAVNDKLEATVLGKESDDPAHFSLFYNQTPTAISTYAGLCNLEASVENANIFGKMSYLVSPGAKAALRGMAKSSKVTQLVLEGGDIDGTPVYSSTNVGKGVGSGTPFVQSGNLIYGDFTNLVIGQWGGLDLTIDTVTQAVAGKVRVIINAFFGVGVLRPQAFAFGLV
jgi:HK97 family phage major capsid protein